MLIHACASQGWGEGNHLICMRGYLAGNLFPFLLSSFLSFFFFCNIDLCTLTNYEYAEKMV